MPRGRPRKTPVAPAPAAPAAELVPAQPALPALPRPITIDTAQLEIPDISLMLRLQSAEGRPEAELQQLVFEMVPMLERLVVGGLAGFKLPDLPAVVTEVFAQLKAAGDPGN
jgi:hypothetical protein